jgi:membrane-anchored protein YejM (alkaline phosphatase superfamily)
MAGFWIWLRRLRWAGLDRIQARHPIVTHAAIVIALASLTFLWTAEPFWRTAALTDVKPASSQASLNGVYTLIKGYEQWRRPAGTLSGGSHGTANPNQAVERVRANLISDEYTPASDLYPLARRIKSRSRQTRVATNFVIVILESFSAKHVGVLNGTRRSLTPNLDRLANGGILFTRFYAHSIRTHDGLAGVVASFPSILGMHIPRRSGTDPLHTLGTLLRREGYETSFIYGFDSRFDHMGIFMKKSGFDHIYDSSDFAAGLRRYTWGVSDEALFDKAGKLLSAQSEDGPFLSVILTSTSHPPYDIPESYFESFPAARDLGKLAAFAYTDWALGKFMEEAARQPYFSNTVFVFVADHGQKINETSRQCKRFHIPLVLYSPSLFKEPRRIRTIGGQVDIGTTLLKLIGYDGVFHFPGRDLLSLPKDDGWVLMRSNNTVFCRFDDCLLAGDVRDTMLTAYAVDSTQRITGTDVSVKQTVVDSMVSFTRDYYNTISYIFRRGLHRTP